MSVNPGDDTKDRGLVHYVAPMLAVDCLCARCGMKQQRGRERSERKSTMMEEPE